VPADFSDQPYRIVATYQPPGRGGSTDGNGQPPFVPTEKQRQKVMDLASCRFTRDQIATALGIPPSTLDRHFATELAEGRLKVHAEIAGRLVEAARNGDRTQRIFYLKTQCGWVEGARVGYLDAQGRPADLPKQTFCLNIVGLDDAAQLSGRSKTKSPPISSIQTRARSSQPKLKSRAHHAKGPDRGPCISPCLAFNGPLLRRRNGSDFNRR